MSVRIAFSMRYSSGTSGTIPRLVSSAAVTGPTAPTSTRLIRIATSTSSVSVWAILKKFEAEIALVNRTAEKRSRRRPSKNLNALPGSFGSNDSYTLTVVTLAPLAASDFASESSADDDLTRTILSPGSECEKKSSTPTELYFLGTEICVTPCQPRASLVRGPTARKLVLRSGPLECGLDGKLSKTSLTPDELINTIQSIGPCSRHDCNWSLIAQLSRGFSSTV